MVSFNYLYVDISKQVYRIVSYTLNNIFLQWTRICICNFLTFILMSLIWHVMYLRYSMELDSLADIHYHRIQKHGNMVHHSNNIHSCDYTDLHTNRPCILLKQAMVSYKLERVYSHKIRLVKNHILNIYENSIQSIVL